MRDEMRLIGEYLRGKDAAFEALFDRHHRSLLAFAYHLAGSASEAEDLCQATWLEALRSLPSYAGRGSFRAWLHGIAVNLHRDGRRKPRINTVALAQEQPGDDARDDPQRAAEQAAVATEVRAALTSLEPEHREVLILHEMQGFTYREIAGIVGCPIGTVKSRLHYAMAAMRVALNNVRTEGGRR